MIIKVLAYIGYLLLLINFLIYLRGFSMRGKAFKVFTAYLLGIFVIQIIMELLNRMGVNNLFLSHFYFLIQFILLSIFYKELLQKKKFSLIINFSMLVIPLVVGVQYLFNIELFYKFNVLEIILTCLPLVFWSLIYFFQQLEENKKYHYVSTAILIYITGSTLIFTSANITSELPNSINKYFWIFNSILYLVFQLLIFYEWWKNFSPRSIKYSR